MLIENSVLIGGRDAARLEPMVRLYMTELRRNGITPSDDTTRLLSDLLRAADRYTESVRAEPDGSSRNTDSGQKCNMHSMNEMSAPAAARAIGIGDRAVRAAVKDGRLPGRKIGGSWAIPRSAVASFAADREITRGAS